MCCFSTAGSDRSLLPCIAEVNQAQFSAHAVASTALPMRVSEQDTRRRRRLLMWCLWSVQGIITQRN